jgi:2-dehydro-3-deoxyphosphogluconate aldolase/(4S)-4-hydroxy-2-oxoglutarate aldolase
MSMPADFWNDQPVIPVVVINNADNAVELARTLVASGTKKIEITLRTPAALEAISRISAEVPEALVGAGTVIDLQTATRAVEAGAKFIVSPGATKNLLKALEGSGLPYLPGCSTLSEALELIDHGVTTAKFFPAVESGGTAWLKAVSSVIPQLSFCPTGGIGLTNYKDFLTLPNVVCVGGSWIAPAKLIDEGNWEEIKKLASQVNMETK